MLFKRYGNPLELLKTFTFEGLADFIIYLFKQDNEDTLFDIWLHKEPEMDFPAFREKHSKNITVKKLEQLSEDEEQTILAEAAKYITPRKKGGD